jgi:serine/threonine protein kinase/Tol biopolymer transport system component
VTEAAQTRRLARFESFEVDLLTGELRKNGEKVKLPEQSFQVLTMLLAKPCEVVMRQEIQKRLWPNDTVVEFENSINAAVKNLRLALGDSADQPRYVETLARRGYRWMTPVEWINESSLPQSHAAAVDSEVSTLAAAYLLGKKVSHYRVLEILGGGGMGVVYKAEDIKLGRRVALKFLPEEMAGDPAAMERFKREARAASALNHPNICTIYSVEEHNGQPFIAMELLEGQTLRELIELPDGATETTAHREPLPLEQLLEIAIQISEGLDAAHQKGIIHRDIKPANVFITSQRRAKILDFGLAKSQEFEGSDFGPSHAGAAHPVANLYLTRTGATIGTAGYMSPEQVRGEKVDSRTDLFSFGLVLYEMAVGRRAFSGETAPVLHTAILNQAPTPVRQLKPTIPLELDTIINKALEKDPEKRYQTASEIAAALENLTHEVPPKSRVMLWVGAVVGTVILSAVAVGFWPTKRQPQPTAELKLTQLTFNSSQNRVAWGAISPDGKYLAYNDLKGVHVKRIGSDDAVAFPQPEELKNRDITWEILTQGWFPDNARFLANAHPQSEDPEDPLGWRSTEWRSATTSIWVFSVAGGAPYKLRDNALAFSVSPDGSMISFGQSPIKLEQKELGEQQIWAMSPSGENVRKLYEAEGMTGLWGLTFLPQGRRAAYIITDESGDTVATRDLMGGPISKLFGPEQTKNMLNPVWLPDGRIIYADRCDTIKMRPDSPCNLRITQMNTLTGELLEKPRQITNWVGQGINISSSTSDGKRVTIQKSFHSLTAYLADVEDGGTRLLNPRLFTPEEGGEDSVVDWTPDHKSIILNLNRADHTTFQKQPLNGAANETIGTLEGLVTGDASLSPDGKWIIAQVCCSPAWGNTLHLVRIPIGGGNPELIFTGPEWSSFFCARSPSNLCAVGEQTADYKQGIITSFDPIKGKGPELARFDLRPEYQTKRMGLIWGISDDGKKLAFAPGLQGPIQIRSLRSGQQQTIRAKGVNDIEKLRWAHDGKGLFFSSTTKRGNEILNVNLHGDIKVLWNCGNDWCRGRPSPDGRQFEFALEKWTSNFWMIENF